MQEEGGARMSTDTARRAVTGELRVPVTPEGQLLLDRITAHTAQVCADAHDNDQAGRFPVDAFERFGKDGILGATVPAELGGLGVRRLHDVAIALSTLAEADASTALALHVQFSRGLTLTYEWLHGAPPARALAERLLRAMADGQAVICGAIKDHPSTITTLKADGAGRWLLSGRKMLVSMAPVATHFFVSAQCHTDGQPTALVAAVLSTDTPGLTVLSNWDGLGMRASGTVDIVLDGCSVDVGDVLQRGAVDARDDAALAGQTVSSITMLGIYAGVAQAARDLAVAAFEDRPASASAGIRTLVAGIDAQLYVLRAAASAALVNADLLSADLTTDTGDRGRRMMTPFQCAKMMVNQLALAIVNDCLTVVGGASYSAANPLSRLYRDVRAGWFMQPYTFVDGVDYLSAQALGLDHDSNYVSVRAVRTGGEGS
jgi:alkylation response protein AidB-like acyl-CoA dehydrogenase